MDLQSTPIGRSGNLPRCGWKDSNSTTGFVQSGRTAPRQTAPTSLSLLRARPPENARRSRYGRRIVRHREQGRQTRGQQRADAVPEGDLPALRLQAVSYTHLRAHETVLDL